MSRIIAQNFSRVEGNLSLKLEIENQQVIKAYITAGLYRGFENILRNRHPLDALVIAPRICGICSVAQSSAAALALNQASGVEFPENAKLCLQLLQACENICDHLTHFYLFFMPDFTLDEYVKKPWYPEVQQKFAANMQGDAAARFLRARSKFLHIMGIIAGKWPHNLAIQPGGMSKALDMGEKIRLLAIIDEFKLFVEKEFFDSSCEEVKEWQKLPMEISGDLGLFLGIASSEGLHKYGRAYENYLTTDNFSIQDIKEDHHSAWFKEGVFPPDRGETFPEPNKDLAYSWAKAPRLGGMAYETGAIARMLAAKQPLLLDLVAENGGNIRERILARGLEIASLLLQMRQWVSAINLSQPFNKGVKLPEEAQVYGLTEAARGVLGHWLRIHKGRIANYQVITPTGWNFSPRDSAGIPGPLEKALEGISAETENPPTLVQHLIRSFDPCMACTVH